MERGRYGKTKSAASRALLEAAALLEQRGRPRKLPGKDRPYMSDDLTKYSLPAAIDYAVAGKTRTTKTVAIEAVVEYYGKAWKYTYAQAESGRSFLQTVDGFVFDTRECARDLRRAAAALAS